MKEKALELVRQLLMRRLEAAGQRPSRPDSAFQLEAGEPAPFGGGMQVQVHTFRKWSDAHVKLDAQTGEPLTYSIDRLSDPPTSVQLTEEDALKLLARSFNIPPDAELASLRHFEFAQGRHMIEMVWNHVYQGLRVDGDRLRVVMHPETGRVVAWERYWREVQL